MSLCYVSVDTKTVKEMKSDKETYMRKNLTPTEHFKR